MEIGSIINYNNDNYLIIDDKDNYGCLKIVRGVGKKIVLKDQIIVDYLTYVNIDKNANITLIDIVSNNKLLSILNTYKNKLNFYKGKPVIQRGSIVRNPSNNKLYYIYGEDSKNWLTFEIKNLPEHNYGRLKIKNKNYYSNYYNININKSVDLNYIGLATSEEIEKIKYTKKRFIGIRKNIEKENNQKVNIMVFGTIISNGDLEYIVLSRKNKKICCIRKDSIKDADPKLHYFNSNDVDLVGHSNDEECKKMIKNLGFLYRTSKVIKK